METTSLAQSPFAALTFIAAPALLTNASSVLALSTINRMLRTRDRMHELFDKSEKEPEAESTRLIEQVNRVERQGTLLLGALHAIYVALAAFASATFVTLLGASLAHFQNALWLRALAGVGVLVGFLGVGGLVIGCINLFRATQLSLLNIRDEATLVRQRQSKTDPHAAVELSKSGS